MAYSNHVCVGGSKFTREIHKDRSSKIGRNIIQKLEETKITWQSCYLTKCIGVFFKPT